MPQKPVIGCFDMFLQLIRLLLTAIGYELKRTHYCNV